MTFVYEPDRGGTGALMRSAKVAAHLARVAADAKSYAESIAPHGATGEYAASFTTEAGEEHIARERRAVVNLANTADHATGVEGRSHVLARTRDYIEGKYG